MMAITSAPRLYFASSDASGRFTLMTISASFSASAATVAPTAVNSESGSPDLIPAPGSTATSTPSALNFFTVSGDAATRGSEGSISLATAIFMEPPAAQGTRVSGTARRMTARSTGLGQEKRHQGNDQDDAAGAVLHQLDEAFIGLLMRGVIVAVSGGGGNFVMLTHQSLQRGLQQSPWNQPNRDGRATAAGGLSVDWCPLFARLGRPIVL